MKRRRQVVKSSDSQQPLDSKIQVRLPLGHSETDLANAIARETSLPEDRLPHWQIVRKSIDARKKGAIRLQYTIELGQPVAQPVGLKAIPAFEMQPVDHEEQPAQDFNRVRPLVVGSGPAGLFAALALAKRGLRPIVIERGQMIDARKAAVDRFWSGGPLDPESNVQFGEGGAGTFSDGKLTTNLHDPRCRAVLEELVIAGAPADILREPKPHVGTDLLCGVVTAIRQTIEKLGGSFYFGTRLDDLLLDDAAGKVEAILISHQEHSGLRSSEIWPVQDVILAIGHSARDTVARLHQLHVPLEPKPFSIGVRIEHPQRQINQSQYGPQAGHPDLPPAEYKLAIHLPQGRSVYTFCMCPGGQVVASASEPGCLVTNGMSLHARNQVNANSALLVEVTPADFPDKGPLGGLFLQRRIEQLAFDLGGGTYRAPAQRVEDFLAKTPSTGPGIVQPSYLPGVVWTDLSLCLPDYISQSLRLALPLLEQKLSGFSAPDAVLTGVETRSSSPVRILRREDLQSSLTGLFPCGEGAGYAGGIVSAAVDGLRSAEAVLKARGVL